MPPNFHLSLVLASVVQGDAVNCNIRQCSKVLQWRDVTAQAVVRGRTDWAWKSTNYLYPSW